MRILLRGAYDPWIGFQNSLIVAGGTTIGAIYFSSLTAFALTAYHWKLRQPFFTFILAVMMVPAQVVTIGFYQMIWRLGYTNNFLPLILPAIASPAIVFFMRQYLLATFSKDIVNSARIDGSGEFRIFNQIVLPMMKPALATQAIFVFVTSWNSLFLPMVLLTRSELYTMPLMVSLLRGDIYRTEFGSIYLALSLSVLPLFVIYFALSKYIISGIQLGGVKE
jgi:multiple sugar transport system permease protein